MMIRLLNLLDDEELEQESENSFVSMFQLQIAYVF